MAEMDLNAWVGRTETHHDEIVPTPYAALSATLDWPVQRPPRGTALPYLWHWLYFLPLYPHALMAHDGHPTKGGFLPPVPLPRRMWAASRFQFHRLLQVGDLVTRTSTIESVNEKTGRSGALVFVTVRHEIMLANEAAAVMTEHQDIVYRPAPGPQDAAVAPKAAPATSSWRRDWVADEVRLFRYSALTFNGHRIHYDRPYVEQVEGYPGLIVHGPLIATLLMDLLRREKPDAQVARFEFRAVRPTFHIHPFSVHGEPSADGRSVHLWAADHEGWLTMDAQVQLR
jgi:3-methylfumaryl-CoA hydratase